MDLVDVVSNDSFIKQIANVNQMNEHKCVPQCVTELAHVSSDKEHYIRFDNYIDSPKNYKYSTVTYDRIDSYDFSHEFIENLIGEDYIHLYFVFDQISTKEHLFEVSNWLDSITKIFVEYSYGKYSNDESIANEYQLKLIEGEDHYVSMHVIYYTTAISTT